MLAMESPKAFAELCEAVDDDFSLEDGSPLAKLQPKSFSGSLPSATQQALAKALEIPIKSKAHSSSSRPLKISVPAAMSPCAHAEQEGEREAFDAVLAKWFSERGP